MSSTRDIQVKQQRDGVSWCQWAAAPCFQLSVNEMSGYCLHVTSTRRLRENYWLIVPVIDSTDITSTSARPRRTDAAAKYSIHVASFNCFITRHTGQFGDDLMTRLYSVIALKDIVSQPPSRVNPISKRWRKESNNNYPNKTGDTEALGRYRAKPSKIKAWSNRPPRGCPQIAIVIGLGVTG